ncbi:DNA ligase 4-like [Ruditapes philippinarum]|uniref:DNA ligase 4-like n=1 Tax=Ruditapes philippinarum TaxID=129788 RepID=UPI00295BD61D|nr:DNA ligase 4-like [Ruditapes philippinarum]
MDDAKPDSPAVTVASKVHFSEMCGLLEKISKTQGNDKKKRILKDFIDQWRKSHQVVHGSEKTTTDSFYPAMRLLLPHLEKERVAYGIKEHMFAKLLIEVLCLGKDSPDAHRLLNYKAPKTAKADVGDFASVVYFVLQNRCPSRGTLFIEEVNDCLDGIATNNVAKKKDAVRKHIVKLITNMSALELKWLTRMIVKELKIGLSQSSVLSVFHPDAEEFYNVNNNLEKVCRMMHDPSVRIHEIGISVFSPFTPMLGERASPDKVEKLMEGKPYFIETKFDGERMLLHKDAGEYKFYSRSGNEYTNIFGSNQYDGTLTQYIHDLFKPDVKTCILDGEMILYHPETETYATKAMNTDVKSTNRDGFQPCLHVFDILFLNDKVLTNLPLKERVKYLEKTFNTEKGRLIISEHKEAKTNQDCADALNEAIDGREEGIMVKNPESVYRPNTRKGGWFKVKPEYVGGLMDELDVLVVGGYFGVGHRAGMMSHFLCAVAVPPKEGNQPEIFYSFCKIGSGYSKKELQDFNAKLVDHWQAFDKKNPPKCIELASGFKEKPDAWIEPSKSAIVQIKAAEIIDSDRFRTGSTLRFPRVEKFRDDKEWYDCMTTDEIEQLKQKSGGKLAGGYVELGEEQEPAKKKRKIVSRAVRPTLGSQFRAADTSSVQQVSKLLEGKEICVINGPSSCPKQELEKKIVECGGSVVQNPGIGTYCVVVEKIVFRVNNMIKTNHYDIVKADWLIRCLDAKSLIPWSPGDMINVSEKTQKLFQQDFDEYGDSYVEETTPERLAQVLAKIQEPDKVLSKTEIAEIEDKYFPDESPYGLFRTCKIYLDNNLVVGDRSTHIKDSSLDLLALELRFFGADMSNKLTADVSHVMVDESDLSRLSELKKERRTRHKKFHIVTPAWVKQCMEEGGVINERAFEPILTS